MATEKYEYNTNRRFGQQSPELLLQGWKLNGNIFFEFFLGDLDKKMTTAGYKRERNKKNTKRDSGKSRLLFNNYSLRSQTTGPELLSVSLQMFWLPSLKDLAPVFEQINISPTATAITVACILY